MNNFRFGTILNKLIAVVFSVIVLFAFAGCAENKGFVFSCDIVDGATVIKPEYSFNLSAVCGGEACEMNVSLNGVLLSGDGEYSAILDKGENEIKATAAHSGKSQTRVYKVIYRADFEISTDIDGAPIINERMNFSASATFNGEPCALIAECNGEALEKSGGKFVASLKIGVNLITLTARQGDLTEKTEREIYCGEFILNTDLSEEDKTEPSFSFRAGATYKPFNADKAEACEITVTLNGDTVSPKGNRYAFELSAGDNFIAIIASSGNAEKRFEYKVRYVDAPPTLETTIKEAVTYRASRYGFDVKAKDGLGEKLDYKLISFAADWTSDGIFTPLGSIKEVWDDSAFTSFEINFKNSEFSPHANSPFDFKVSVKDGAGRETSAVYKMTYIPAEEGEKTGEVVFALEGFSIGCGYFIKPCKVPVYEGKNFAQTLTEIIEKNGWTYTNTGTVLSGFYLSGIKGLDLRGNRIPDELWALLPEGGKLYQSMPQPEEGEYDLAEFCYAQGGGWMYSVNTVYKNYGFSDYYPQDGDVVRVQFTVALGSDLGGGGALGGDSSASWLSENPDYGEIMRLLAEIAQKLECGGNFAAYDEAINAVSKWNISQKTMDEQIAGLKLAYGI